MKVDGNQKDTVLQINEAILPLPPRGITGSLGSMQNAGEEQEGKGGRTWGSGGRLRPPGLELKHQARGILVGGQRQRVWIGLRIFICDVSQDVSQECRRCGPGLRAAGPSNLMPQAT